MMRFVCPSLACLALACTAITDPGRFEFYDGGPSGIDGGPDGGAADGGAGDGGDASAGTDAAAPCRVNEHVVSGSCEACGPGTTNEAGDDPSGADTSCDPTRCDENERVQAHACVPCEAGQTNGAGDDASGGDTPCDGPVCAADQHVVDGACVSCPPGTTNDAGDDPGLGDTPCDPVLCTAGQRVQAHACVPCPAGTSSASNHDASGPDTSCACQGSHLDCNGDIDTDGCEADGDSDPAHCGDCSTACTYDYCAAGECVFTRWGTYTPGASSENRGANALQGLRLPVSASTTLRALGIRTGAVIGTPHVRLALYRDVSGAPGALVAQTEELTAVSSGATEGPVTPTALTPGTYWLFFISDATLRVTTLGITAEYWAVSPFTFGPLPPTLPGLTGATLAEANVYVVTTP